MVVVSHGQHKAFVVQAVIVGMSTFCSLLGLYSVVWHLQCTEPEYLKHLMASPVLDVKSLFSPGQVMYRIKRYTPCSDLA